jgi:MFS transporter, Spinster family, sphingosine-1-phosphate transporter
MALCITTIHLFGDVPSPTLIGYLSDRSSIQRAMMLVPAAVVVSGAIWLFAAWRGESHPSTIPAVEA